MRVHVKRRACIGVAELGLCYWNARAGLDEKRRVCVTECVKTSALDFEKIEQRIQLPIQNVLAVYRSAGRKEFGGLKLDQAKRLKELEKENAKLKRLVAELSLEKQVLKDVAEGNF